MHVILVLISKYEIKNQSKYVIDSNIKRTNIAKHFVYHNNYVKSKHHIKEKYLITRKEDKQRQLSQINYLNHEDVHET